VIRLVAALVALLLAGPAAAERLILGLSTESISVTSSFQGTDVVVFAVVEPDRQTGARRGAYDAVVVIRGPSASQVVRRREQFGPIWINGSSRTYLSSPTFYAALSSRALPDIALDQVRREAMIGLDQLRLVQQWAPRNPAEDGLFREAFIASKREEGLYAEGAGAPHLEFLAPNVFRARVSLPANVPTGLYTIEAMVLSEGFVVGRETASFRVDKMGFEAAVFAASREQPLLYGIATVVLAIGTGWLAGVMFRRN